VLCLTAGPGRDGGEDVGLRAMLWLRGLPGRAAMGDSPGGRADAAMAPELAASDSAMAWNSSCALRGDILV
jgi:hypothetical protein